MYEVGERVRVTAWEFDLQSTQVLEGTVVEVDSTTNRVTVEMDSGQRRQFQLDEVERFNQ